MFSFFFSYHYIQVFTWRFLKLARTLIERASYASRWSNLFMDIYDVVTFWNAMTSTPHRKIILLVLVFMASHKWTCGMPILGNGCFWGFERICPCRSPWHYSLPLRQRISGWQLKSGLIWREASKAAREGVIVTCPGKGWLGIHKTVHWLLHLSLLSLSPQELQPHCFGAQTQYRNTESPVRGGSVPSRCSGQHQALKQNRGQVWINRGSVRKTESTPDTSNREHFSTGNWLPSWWKSWEA